MASSVEQTIKNNDADNLLQITDPVKAHMAEVTRFMKQQVLECEPEVQEYVKYSLKSSGKRLRPILVFYCGWTDRSHEEVNPDLVKVASIVEFVHLSTLVHDDILDNAVMRHSYETVTKKYGADVAVLTGDAIFSHALKLAADFDTTVVCRLVAQSTRRVCAGEISQTLNRGDVVSMAHYFRVINYKTAELFQVSCYLGAKLAGYPDSFAESAGNFGRHLGIAYQIFDDMADYFGDEKKIGKTLGTDLESAKFTLPLLLLLERLGAKEADALIRDVQAQKFKLEDLNGLFTKFDIANQVKRYFLRELEAAEASLAPYIELPPSEHLIRLARFVRTMLKRLNIPDSPSKL